MTSPLSRITFNVDCQNLGDPQLLLDTLSAWRPTAVFCMSSLNGSDPGNIVVRIHALVAQWGGIVVYREYGEDEGELWKHYSPDSYLDKCAGHNAPWAWFNVGNEPGPRAPSDIADMSNWYAKVTTRAVARNIRVVLPGGFATASYSRAEIKQFGAMLKTIGGYRKLKVDGHSLVMFGVHIYADALPMFATAGIATEVLMNHDAIQPAHYPKQADIFRLDGHTDGNWLVGREWWYVEEMAAQLGISVAELIKDLEIGVTECILDRMDSTEINHRAVSDFIDARCGTKYYGYGTLGGYWQWAYGLPPSEVMCLILKWIEQTFPECYGFFAQYQWTLSDENPHYWSSRYSEHRDQKILDLWPQVAAEIGTHVTVPNVPLPADAGTPLSGALRSSSTVNLRAALMDGGVIYAVPNMKPVRRYPATEVLMSVGGKTYHGEYVEVLDKPGGAVQYGGYMALVVAQTTGDIDAAWRTQIVPDKVLVKHGKIDVPFNTQNGLGQFNLCMEACIASLAEWKADVELGGHKDVSPLDVAGLIPDRKAGESTDYDQGIAAAKLLGIILNKAAPTANDLMSQIDLGLPSIVDFIRKFIPGWQAIYAQDPDGPHLAVLDEYWLWSDGLIDFAIEDSLGFVGKLGDSYRVSARDLMAGMTATGYASNALLVSPLTIKVGVPPADAAARTWTEAEINALIDAKIEEAISKL